MTPPAATRVPAEPQGGVAMVLNSPRGPVAPRPEAAPQPEAVTGFDDQVRLLRWLAAHFAVRCEVRPTRPGRSWAFLDEWRIELAPTPRLGLYGICLHEFAHLLAEARQRGGGQRHGTPFCVALWDSVEAVGLPPATYPWWHEYQMVARYWRRRLGHSAPASRP